MSAHPCRSPLPLGDGGGVRLRRRTDRAAHSLRTFASARSRCRPVSNSLSDSTVILSFCTSFTFNSRLWKFFLSFDEMRDLAQLLAVALDGEDDRAVGGDAAVEAGRPPRTRGTRR